MIILILSVLQVNNLKIFSFKHTLCNVFALFDCNGPVVHFLATDTFNISPTIPSAGFGSNVTNALFLKNWRIGFLHDDYHHYKNRFVVDAGLARIVPNGGAVLGVLEVVRHGL